MSIQTLSTASAMTQWAQVERASGRTIGFVPTMGYLHEGHASLMRLLRPRVDRLVVSIFVNPLQFAPHEDFDVYPRDPEGDLAICVREGVDAVFFPPPAGDPEGLYPLGFETRISVPALDHQLCSTSRPHFFTGVATVVYRLFRVVQCHVAAFGEKDYQQLAIIRRMVNDLGLDIDIVGGPIVREVDGLAMSSRNVYLSPGDRNRACSISRAIRAIEAAASGGLVDVETLVTIGRAALDVDSVDYLSIVDATTLQPTVRIDSECRVAIAAQLGNTRLIDNGPVRPPQRVVS